MTELESKRCLACESGIPSLTHEKITLLLAEIPHWETSSDQKLIQRRFIFKNFYQTMAFVNALAFIAHQENHHPDLEIGFNYCLVKYSTHAAKGLTENDFICAAKVNALLKT